MKSSSYPQHTHIQAILRCNSDWELVRLTAEPACEEGPQLKYAAEVVEWIRDNITQPEKNVQYAYGRSSGKFGMLFKFRDRKDAVLFALRWL